MRPSRWFPLFSLFGLMSVLAQDPAAYREPELTAKEREHWAFRKPVRPDVPLGESNPIDAFIPERLRMEGLTPSS